MARLRKHEISAKEQIERSVINKPFVVMQPSRQITAIVSKMPGFTVKTAQFQAETVRQKEKFLGTLVTVTQKPAKV